MAGAIASSLAKGLTNLPGEPAETNSRSSICSQSSSACPSVSSATASAENNKTLHEGSHGGDGQINPMLESQLLPPAQERSLLMKSRDDIQLLENLLTESPDCEDLVSSMEPLLPDSIIPSLDPTEPRDSGQAQELLATPSRPCVEASLRSPKPRQTCPSQDPLKGNHLRHLTSLNSIPRQRGGKAQQVKGNQARKGGKQRKAPIPPNLQMLLGKECLWGHIRSLAVLLSVAKKVEEVPPLLATSETHLRSPKPRQTCPSQDPLKGNHLRHLTSLNSITRQRGGKTQQVKRTQAGRRGRQRKAQIPPLLGRERLWGHIRSLAVPSPVAKMEAEVQKRQQRALQTERSVSRCRVLGLEKILPQTRHRKP
ncbi:uncharacterized protein LOC140705709 isoform X2 [Pogona vitticeps]